MVKTVALIKRKPGLTHEEFVKHYEEVHAPLALEFFGALKKYVRNYLVGLPGEEEPPFDCITEFWFEDLAAGLATQELSQSEAAQALHEDEDRFMDRASVVSFLVEERSSLQLSEGVGGPQAEP